jgi:hypothetical protein
MNNHHNLSHNNLNGNIVSENKSTDIVSDKKNTDFIEQNLLSNPNTIINVGLLYSAECTDNDRESFENYCFADIISEVKMHKRFSMECQNIPFDRHNPIIHKPVTKYSRYNYIFYYTKLSSINNKDVINDLKYLGNIIEHPRQHLFIVVDRCNKMHIDDDGDLLLSTRNEHSMMNNFEKEINVLPDDFYHIFKINTQTAKIWKIIDDTRSLKNLTEDDINLLTDTLIDKNRKTNDSNKKKILKEILGNINFDTKLAETGYTELNNKITFYFKLFYQKKIVCQNYLFNFKHLELSTEIDNNEHIYEYIKEINKIDYLKQEVYDELINQFNESFQSKLNKFLLSSKNKVTIKPVTLESIDVYKYHKILMRIHDFSKELNMTHVMETLNKEIENVNKMIVDFHSKEIEKMSNLDQISALLKIFSKDNTSNMLDIFKKIQTNPKLISENILNMDKWCIFIDHCLKLGIPLDMVIKLVEDIIISKVTYYSDLSMGNRSELGAIYPQCLNAFLLTQMDKHFVFIKLQIYVSHVIKYSGRNIADLMKHLTSEQYKSLLVLENKLLEICKNQYDEQSNHINVSDLEIVETFNENK